MGGWNPCITGAPHLHPHCHLPHLLSLTVLSLHWHCLSAPSVCTSLCCLSHSLPLSACHLSVPPSLTVLLHCLPHCAFSLVLSLVLSPLLCCLLCCLPCYAASLAASCCLPLFPCSLPSLCAVSPTVLSFSSHHLPHHAVSLAISLISPAASSHHLAPLSHHLSPCCLLLPPLSHH